MSFVIVMPGLFPLAEEDYNNLQELNLSDYLPCLEVFKKENSAFNHLSKSCKGGQRETVPFLDANIDSTCKTCATSTWETIGEFEDNLKDLAAILPLLKAAEKYALEVDAGVDANVGHLGSALTTLRLHCTDSLDVLEETKFVPEVIKALKDRVVATKETILTFLHSSAGAAAVQRNVPRKYPFWVPGHNCVIFHKDAMRRISLAIAEVYGKEISSGVYVAHAPINILSYLYEDTLQCAPLFMDHNVPKEVLQTFGTLWEPDAETVFGDPAKALSAAWDLTPRG